MTSLLRERPPREQSQPRSGNRSLRKALLAVAGGLLLFASHPPLDLGLLGPVALVPLLALARDCEGRVRAGAGWGAVAGVAFFGPLLWWIARFGVVAWVALVTVQTVFIVAFVALVAAWGRRPLRVLAVVVLWAGIEAARTRYPLGGFPWGALGYSQHAGGPLLPLARLVGVVGLSGVCAAIAAGLEELLARRRVLPLAVVVAVVAVLVVGVPAPPLPNGATVDIASVQGNEIESTSAAGVARESTTRIVGVAQQVVEATQPLAVDPPQVTVWPENSLDGDLRDPDNDDLRRLLAEGLGLVGGRPLLAGGVFLEPGGRIRNVMLEVLPTGAIDEVYVKRKPVPFGEYVPFREWLEWFPPLQQIPRDMVPGERATVFDVAGIRIGTVICFENVFPWLVHEEVREGAQVLVVSTNNASFGRTPATAQHLAFTQVRAVETGRWVLHAGISGPSAVVDPTGGLSQRTQLFDEAIVRADLPLVDGWTPATRFATGLELTALWLTLGAAVWLLFQRRRAR